MKLSSDNTTPKFFTIRMIVTIMVLCSIIGVAGSAFVGTGAVTYDHEQPGHNENDSIESVAAFTQVYSVLMHPRCMNCHPKGDVPLQGDDSHFHTMAPKRGKDGHGLYAMKCSNCHQP